MTNKTDKNLLVLVGSGRSGTTYLARVLKQNLDYGFTTEPKFIIQELLKLKDPNQELNEREFNKILKKIYHSHSFDVLRAIKNVSTNYDEFRLFVKERTFEDIVYGALDYTNHLRGNKNRGFKDPNALKYIDRLSETFPESKFIHIYRDGRDVAKSTLKFKWGGNNLYVNAVEWAKYTKAGRVQGQKLGDRRYLELKFEDMVLNPQGATEKITDFLNITDEDTVADLYSYFQSTLNKDKIYNWKSNYTEKEIQLFDSVAGATLREFGYDSKDHQSTLSLFTSSFYVAHDYFFRVVNVVTRSIEKIINKS